MTRQRSNQTIVYRITVRGRLEAHWSDWFEGMRIATDGAGNCTLVGSITDQAALHGLLVKIRDLGIVLLCLEQVEEEK